MGDLRDALEAGGYSGHELERLLVRVLFCLFAEDTGIFDRNSFQLFLENHTKPDGSDLGPQIAQFFQTLNRPKDKRQKNLLEELAELPYVNGELFAESLKRHYLQVTEEHFQKAVDTAIQAGEDVAQNAA